MNNHQATVVIAAKAGRLGNRLFLSAYFMANALAQGYRLLNPALGEYASLFEGSAYDSWCAFPASQGVSEVELVDQCRSIILNMAAAAGSIAGRFGLWGVKEIDIRRSYDAEERVYDLCNDSFVELLQSSQYLVMKGWKFRDHENLVRFHEDISRYFLPVAPIRQSAEKALSKARSEGDFVVGVHVRQGDYRGWKNGIHYFETEQYAHWMRECRRLYLGKNISFLLCVSDPIDWSLFHGLNIVKGPGSFIADLHALSLCEAIMGPPSTFSTWASYLGRVPLCMLQHAGQVLSMHDFVLHDRV